ncbi:inter-alpha-trypsin inhibitor heavy chain H3-like [Cetorhinus maximus]
MVVTKPEENKKDSFVADKLSEDDQKSVKCRGDSLDWGWVSLAEKHPSRGTDSQEVTRVPEQLSVGDGELPLAGDKGGVEIILAHGRNDGGHGISSLSTMGCCKFLETSNTPQCTKICKDFSISIMKERNLTLTMGDAATFVIVLHWVRKNHTVHRDFLGFYTLDSHRLSNMTHGLLGQFYHEVNAEIYNIRPGLDQSKLRAKMIVKGHKLMVTRVYEKDYRLDSNRGTNVPCWFVSYNVKGFIDGIPTDYVVSSLFDSIYP